MKVLLINLLILFSITSCSLFTKKGKWGKDALWPIKGSRVAEAFKKNITSPHVFGPLAAAGAIWIGGFDEKMSDWIWDENIIYDNHQDADRWSDTLAKAMLIEMYAAPLLTPSYNEDGSFKEYAFSKAKGYIVISASTQVADHAHDDLADRFQRERPNKADHRSLPSGHSTQAGSRNMIISKTLDAIPMDEHLRFGIKTVNTSMASLILWARVEGKAHYPTDALTGYALGAFISGFIYDSLMNFDAENPETFSLVPGKDKLSFQYTYAF